VTATVGIDERGDAVGAARWRAEGAHVLRVASATLLAGGIAGLLVAGLGGRVYALVRPVLPERRRPLVWGTVTGLFIGSSIIHADGVDYAVLGSRWVSVAMFAAISAGYGALTAHLAERSLRPGGAAWTRGRVGVGLPFVLVVPGGTFVAVGLGLAAVVAARATGLVARLRRIPVALVGRVALGVLVLVTAADLVRTVADLA
jgi:hypothetical protein